MGGKYFQIYHRIKSDASLDLADILKFLKIYCTWVFFVTTTRRMTPMRTTLMRMTRTTLMRMSRKTRKIILKLP